MDASFYEKIYLFSDDELKKICIGAKINIKKLSRKESIKRLYMLNDVLETKDFSAVENLLSLKQNKYLKEISIN